MSFNSKPSALSTQEGGDHYKKYAIQPVEYAMANNLNYCQANAIKYTTRYKDKGGIEDLRKAIHNLEILIELEERNGKLGRGKGTEEKAAEPKRYRSKSTNFSVPSKEDEEKAGAFGYGY